MRNDGAAGCTSPQRNAHVIGSRVVLYRWHPWHGRAVMILGAVVKHEHAVYRCVLDQSKDRRPLEVPQWMFDAAACCQIALSAAPAVTWQALREVRGLIESAYFAGASAVLQAEHLPIPDPGGARATDESSVFDRPVGTVSSASHNAAVERPARRGAPASGKSGGAATANALPRSPRRGTGTGGER